MHGEVTRLLQNVETHQTGAADALWTLVYDELQRLARRAMADERNAHTLQPTALVNEAWLKLVQPEGDPGWEGRAHFFRTAARAMRHILVDHARARGRRKRGGDAQRVDLDVDRSTPAPITPDLDLIALDDALAGLGEMDEELARLVELRFFAGLSIADTARVLGRSTATVERSWRVARAWLRRAMDGEVTP